MSATTKTDIDIDALYEVIYFVEAPPRYVGVVREVIRRIGSGEVLGYKSFPQEMIL